MQADFCLKCYRLSNIKIQTKHCSLVLWAINTIPNPTGWKMVHTEVSHTYSVPRLHVCTVIAHADAVTAAVTGRPDTSNVYFKSIFH